MIDYNRVEAIGNIMVIAQSLSLSEIEEEEVSGRLLTSLRLLGCNDLEIKEAAQITMQAFQEL